MGVLMWLAIGLMFIGLITVSGLLLMAVLIWLSRPRRAPVTASMVLDEMAEQRAPTAQLPCRCVVHLLPDGDSYVAPCRRHSYMRNPDFGAWLTELDSDK